MNAGGDVLFDVAFSLFFAILSFTWRMLKYFMHHNVIAFGSFKKKNRIMHDHSDPIRVSHKSTRHRQAPKKITSDDCIIGANGIAMALLSRKLLHRRRSLAIPSACCLTVWNGLRGCRRSGTDNSFQLFRHQLTCRLRFLLSLSLVRQFHTIVRDRYRTLGFDSALFHEN